MDSKALRLSKLEFAAWVQEKEAMGLRSTEDLDFFAVHGYYPEAADVSERTEHSFETHGLRTTIILERVGE